MRLVKLIFGGCSLALLAALLAASSALAQSDAPLPALPPTPPPPAQSSPKVETAPPPPRAAPVVVYAEPSSRPLVLPTRAPRYSLWLGGGVGLLAYGGGLYLDNPSTQAQETVGNFVRPGLGVEVDVGARLDRRYIPYLVGELGLVGAGHRFEGVSASANTHFVGVGFRFLAGDVNNVSLVSDLSFGLRQFQVSSNGQTWSATGLELFRVGVGVDIRLTRQLTLSPLLTLSGGSLGSTSGHVSYAPNQGDGVAGTPTFANGSIPGNYQSTYYAVVLGCGGHFDLFSHY
jgi:hypothetical protein